MIVKMTSKKTPWNSENSVVKKKTLTKTLHTASPHHPSPTINYQLKKTMENKTLWSKILNIINTVLTANATTFGVTSCIGA